MTVPAFSSRGSMPRFMQRIVTSLFSRGRSRVAATATPLSPLSNPSMSPTGPLGSELSLHLTCTSLSGGSVSVRMIWTLLARRRPIRSVHWIVLPPITNNPLSQATEQSCLLRNSIPRMALSEMRQTRNLASNGTFRRRPDRPMLPYICRPLPSAIAATVSP